MDSLNKTFPTNKNYQNPFIQIFPSKKKKKKKIITNQNRDPNQHTMGYLMVLNAQRLKGFAFHSISSISLLFSIFFFLIFISVSLFIFSSFYIFPYLFLFIYFCFSICMSIYFSLSLFLSFISCDIFSPIIQLFSLNQSTCINIFSKRPISLSTFLTPFRSEK